MSARTWKLGMAGLGALSLSCAGLDLSHVSTGNTVVDTAVAAFDVGNKVVVKTSECAKLKAKASFEEERALGGAVALKWVAGGGGLLLSEKSETQSPLANEEALQEYINIVGRNLAAQSSRPTLPWTFGVLKARNAFNATSAPGGYIFVTRGLLKDVENEAQLAGVLAHEIAHVTLQHALTHYDEVKVSQCEVMAVGEGAREGVARTNVVTVPEWLTAFRQAIDGTGVLDLDHNASLLGHLTEKMVEKVVSAGYAKEDEHAADEQAVHLLLSAGYDAREYIRFLGKLPEGRAHFAHHPKKQERQKRLEALLGQASQPPREGEFPELPSPVGLSKPPLPPVFAVARSAGP